MEKQYRCLTMQDVRADTSTHKLTGYFAVFDGVYQLAKEISESISPHAFDDCLNDDIRCLWNHNANIVLGRTTNNTLKLEVDKKGLKGTVEINPKDSDALNALARVERGDVTQCSFGFEILEESCKAREDGGSHFTIEKVKLFEVSPVTFPAYADTSIKARGDDIKSKIETQKRLERAKKEEEKEKLKNGLKKAIGA